MIPAEHEGCSQKSIEEGEIIKTKYDALIGQEFTDRDCCRVTRSMFSRGGRQSQTTGNPMRHCGADETGQHILLAV